MKKWQVPILPCWIIFFYNIEKNVFFSTIVLQSQRGLRKGSCLIEFKNKTKQRNPNTTANQQKVNSRPSFQQLLLLPWPTLLPNRPPFPPSHPCPIPSRKQWHSWRSGRGQHGAHSTEMTGNRNSIYRETGSYAALHMLRVHSGTVWSSAFLSNTLNWESQLRSIKKPNKPVHLKKCNA